MSNMVSEQGGQGGSADTSSLAFMRWPKVVDAETNG